ncbi:TraR/DksA C4-type zinc finger protein [Pseudoalteromonas luteoviolacea]|uniref:TraR/DksA C4-type zinc finger protein n=1 Tax=Pseudoalteromonas luteoviolacea TaxID=43657 RepID=UPI0011520E9D|nr:TraR/DksA C4-type zinc finger protein [Pseudoalteromonas luteoviolacea]TQF69565.1 conjugal transfer protein TraR [Pseudoalteromonas luteoviolacea]
MDDADRAQIEMEQAIKHKLAQHQTLFNGPDVDLSECAECGAHIPEARRKAIHNCRTCVDCQQRMEAKR